jgi:hypothetical protein
LGYYLYLDRPCNIFPLSVPWLNCCSVM